MSSLGKVFIYEKHPEHLKQYQNAFELNGFFVFGTDNLYLLMQYTKEINPDIVILNLPVSLVLDDESKENLENIFCQTKRCPQVFINYNLSGDYSLKIKKNDFDTEDLSYEQILRIITNSNLNDRLH